MSQGFQNLSELKKVLERFKRIPNQSYFDFIYFYQQYFDQIQHLHFDEYLEIKYSYINALFQLDKFELLHKQINGFVAELLNHAEFNYYHRKIYLDCLHLKSQAYLIDYRSVEAIRVLKEIIKIEPDYKGISKKLFTQLFKIQQHHDRKYYALIVISIMSTLLLTAISAIVIEPFYPNQIYSFQLFRNILFGCTAISLLALLTKTYLAVYKEIKLLKRE